MKNIFFIAFYFLTFCLVYAQEAFTPAEAEVLFGQFKETTAKHKDLWGVDLYGPILLIDSDTRTVFANVRDSLGELKAEGSIYIGSYPKNLLIANTNVSWNATDWAMVMLPLPNEMEDRMNLMAHERFHVVQKDLGFTTFNTENAHLDQRDGRIYFRLELEALKQAVQEKGQAQVNIHLTHAFAFRKYRTILYPGSDISENQLELNEGLAEYTGEASSGREMDKKAAHFISNIDHFYTSPSFIRSFAYQTIPVYGYLLDLKETGWNKKINKETLLVDMFIQEFQIQLPELTPEFISDIASLYQGDAILKEELAREEAIHIKIKEYKECFIEQPHLEVRLENMRIQFNTNNLITLEDKGTVYPTMKVIDNWGVLTVTNGGLMDPSWKRISLSNPTKIDHGKIEGNGWVLELKEGYHIEKEVSGNYQLIKKESF